MLCDAFEYVGNFTFSGQQKEAVFQYFFLNVGEYYSECIKRQI